MKLLIYVFSSVNTINEYRPLGNELTIKNLHIAAVPYNHARIMRARCDFKSATGDRGAEI